MRSFRHLSLLLLVAVSTSVMGCGDGNKKQQNQQQDSTISEYTPPAIPIMLTQPEDRAIFLAENYWNKFEFQDSSIMNSEQVKEQAFVNFITILDLTPENVSNSALNSFMQQLEKGDSSVYMSFMDITEKYLYDPNSPYRNENYYIPILENIIKSNQIDSIYKISPEYQLEMVLKNRPGTPAANVTITTKSGQNKSLGSINNKYIILFFNNPDCTDCKRVKNMLEINPATNNKDVTIMAIYTDEDIELWQNTEYPNGWINGYDKNQVISNTQSYDLRAIPTLYLIDGKTKNVILKDQPIENIINYIDAN